MCSDATVGKSDPLMSRLARARGVWEEVLLVVKKGLFILAKKNENGALPLKNHPQRFLTRDGQTGFLAAAS